MTVPLLAVLLVSGAFAVDLGMQRVARADMQALADVVALDLARELDGRTVNALVDVLEEKKERSLARNHDMVGSAKPDLAVTMGVLSETGQFTELLSGAPTAVRVVAGTRVSFAFGGVTGVDSGRAERRAVAVLDGGVSGYCFKVGSYTGVQGALFATLVNGIFGRWGEFNSMFTNSTVSYVDYAAMANVNVDLVDLARQLGHTVRTLSESTVDAGSFFRALHAVLPAGTPTSVANALQGFFTYARPKTIRMGNVIAVTSDGSGAGVTVNVLDMVANALKDVNGSTQRYVDSNWISLPLMTNLGGGFTLAPGARQFCANAGDSFRTVTGEASQLTVSTNGNLKSSDFRFTAKARISGLLDGSFDIEAPSNFPMTFTIRPTDVKVVDATCEKGVETMSFDVSSAGSTVEMTGTYVDYQLSKAGTTIKGKPAQIRFGGNMRFFVNVDGGSVRYTMTAPPYGVAALPFGDSTVPRFDASSTSYGYIEIKPDASLTLSAAEENQIKSEVRDAIVRAWLDTSNPNSISNQIMNPILALAGTSVNGPTIILDGDDERGCGSGPDGGVPALRG
ncbi:hypothetical protein GCM10009788_26900 [Nocardioides humi]|uniref:Flp pilus-assembly TadG-like N-terminal domain-containing protein n=2 Tax=Nocardioides humi TaxID=449461 RepID=A0ABN2AMM6_9ACTN